jgi:hypothetical protein
VFDVGFEDDLAIEGINKCFDWITSELFSSNSFRNALNYCSTRPRTQRTCTAINTFYDESFPRLLKSQNSNYIIYYTAQIQMGRSWTGYGHFAVFKGGHATVIEVHNQTVLTVKTTGSKSEVNQALSRFNLEFNRWHEVISWDEIIIPRPAKIRVKNRSIWIVGACEEQLLKLNYRYSNCPIPSIHFFGIGQLLYL